MLQDSVSVTNINDYDIFKEIRTRENRAESSSIELLGANSCQVGIVGVITMPIEIDAQTLICKMMIIKDLV